MNQTCGNIWDFTCFLEQANQYPISSFVPDNTCMIFSAGKSAGCNQSVTWRPVIGQWNWQSNAECSLR